MSATEEVVEGALDVAEQTVDAMESHLLLSRKEYLVQVAVIGAFAGLVVGAITRQVTKKQMQAKYERIIEQEIAEAKAFYATLNKHGDLSTPEGTVRSLHPEKAVEDATGALLRYQGQAEEDDSPESETLVEVETESQVNVFRETRVDDNFDFEEELKRRTPDAPYILHEEEFMQNEPEFQQTTLTYYAGDGTLADERDEEIPFADPIVGEANLQRFGHGSGDSRTVFIRNEKLSCDFEVLLSDGKYAHEVLGLEHSDGGSRERRRRNQPRKFRGEDV